MTTLMQNLAATGLNPIIIDENTDMTTLPSVANPIDDLAAGAKALVKALNNIGQSAANVKTQREVVTKLRVDIARALDAGGEGFDAASKAYKSANNKLDKLIDASESSVDHARAGICALRAVLDTLEDSLYSEDQA